ncbi:MAG: hypothetical protein R3229_02050 [Alphaproteobacteria bacterium]|nr:hypothetical protein [Alphaproteobacteria bacterium]
MTGDPAAAARRRVQVRWGRLALIVAGLLGLYLLGQWITEMVARQFGLVMHVRSEPTFHILIMTASAIYVALMAVPFMPGVEIGVTMILMFGTKICFLVYLCTVAALIPPYLIGRLIPLRYCVRASAFLGLGRVSQLLREIEPLDAEARLAFLLAKAPDRITPFLLRHRFLALAVVLNLPGNMVIGGGGGIAMLAGVSGLYPLPAYLLTVALAVAPVPVVIALSELGL